MGQISYQRPREKLLDRGVRALSNVELLHILINSGSQGISAARIAKNVAAVIKQSESLSYEELMNVRGMGQAKATQIIAALELGDRVSRQVAQEPPESSDFLHIKTASKRTIEYLTIGGAGERLQERFETINDIAKSKLAVRKMFACALHDYAGSLVIGVGSKSQQIDALDNDTLQIMKMIFDTASLLEVKVNTVWLVSAVSRRAFYRKAIE